MNTILPTVFSFTASKKVITAVLLFVSMSFYAQVVVTDVYPTRVTKGSKITVIGSGFSNSTTVSIDNISIGSVEATPDGTELSFEITRDEHPAILTNKALKISNQNVYIGSNSPENQVKFEYVGAKLKKNTTTNTSSSEYFDKITDIITNWNYDNQGYWRSTSNYVYGDSSTYPNDSHELLAFEYNGVFYSTGVDDDLLDNIPGFTYNKEVFKAYSTNGITGTINNGANFIATGDLVDGVVNEGTTITSAEILDLTVFQVMVDGINGLDLGTGVTNYNKSASIRFFSGNGDVGAVSDGVPDLIITQIADSGSYDIYYYADELGNVKGTPIRLYMSNGTGNLGRWALDLYKLASGADINTATPQTRTFNSSEYRYIKLVGLNLEDFDLNGSNLSSVENINSVAGGSADMAFIAYNQSAFDIKAPIVSPILPQYVCKADGTTDVTFSVDAGIEDGSGGVTDPPADNAGLELKYKWKKYNSDIAGATSETFTISNVEVEDLATYKVVVYNEDGGTVILPVTLSEGGTPYYYNGSDWNSPYGVVDEKERGIVFAAGEYNDEVNLNGCDCQVASGAKVTIPSGYKMVLQNEIIVEPEVVGVVLTDEEGHVVYDENGDEIYIVNPSAAGSFTLEDDASLVQINDVENSGEIIVKRTVEGETLHAYDYVYWSTPVEDASVSTMPGNLKFKWDVDGANTVSGAVGNWTSATGIMEIGRGYIARVSSAIDYTAAFRGMPNNGDINIEVKTTPTSEPGDMDSSGMASGEKHWNLIGNPYPSAIDPAKLLSNNTNLEGAVYVWTHTDPISASVDDPFYDNFNLNYSDQYIAYNGTGSSRATNEGENYIASGQGFFVKVLDAADSSSNVTFTNAMRYNDAEEAYDNDQFYRSSTEAGVTTEKQLLWLSLADENDSAISTLIGYVEGATEGKDRVYDAQTNNGGFNIYSLTSEDDNLVIQGLPLPFVDYNTVPLGYEVSASGIYRIAIADVKGSIFEEQEQDIYVEDTYTGVVHDLRASTYAFTSESGVFNDRFILRYTPSVTLSVDEIAADTTFAFINNATLNVKSSDGIKAIEVYDINGKTVVNYTLRGSENTFNTNFNFARGVYVASITLDNGSVVTKKLMN